MNDLVFGMEGREEGIYVYIIIKGVLQKDIRRHPIALKRTPPKRIRFASIAPKGTANSADQESRERQSKCLKDGHEKRHWELVARNKASKCVPYLREKEEGEWIIL